MGEKITSAELLAEYQELLDTYPPRHCVTVLSERHRLSQKAVKAMLASEGVEIGRVVNVSNPAESVPEAAEQLIETAFDAAYGEPSGIPEDIQPWYGDTLERIRAMLDMVQAGDSKLFADYIIAASHELLRQAALS